MPILIKGNFCRKLAVMLPWVIGQSVVLGKLEVPGLNPGGAFLFSFFFCNFCIILDKNVTMEFSIFSNVKGSPLSIVANITCVGH